MGLTLRSEKGSKLTISELDSNLVGLKNMTFVGQDFSEVFQEFPIEAGFYGETITNYGPDIDGILGALDLGTASFFYSPAVLNDVDITYFGTKVNGSAVTEEGVIHLLSLNGFINVKEYDASFGNGGYLLKYTTTVDSEIVNLFVNIETSVSKIFYGFGKNLPYYNHTLMVQSIFNSDPIINYKIDVNSETEEITVTVKTLMVQV